MSIKPPCAVWLRVHDRQHAFHCRCGHALFAAEYRKEDTRFTCDKCKRVYICSAGVMTEEIKKPA